MILITQFVGLLLDHLYQLFSILQLLCRHRIVIFVKFYVLLQLLVFYFRLFELYILFVNLIPIVLKHLLHLHVLFFILVNLFVTRGRVHFKAHLAC